MPLRQPKQPKQLREGLPSAPLQQATFAYLIGRLERGIRREMSARLQPWGLRVGEYTILSVLRARPGLSNAQLARRALISPQAMNVVLINLEGRGFVTRLADPLHARILRASLTARATEVLDEIRPVMASLQRELLSDLPAGGEQVMMEALVKVMNRLSQHQREKPRD